MKLFDNRLKYVHFPMIEETFFREGEAVFILEFCARLTTEYEVRIFISRVRDRK